MQRSFVEFGFGVLPELADGRFEGGIGGFVEGDAGTDAVEIDA